MTIYIWTFLDVFGGGFHLWETLLQQEPGCQERSEHPSLSPHEVFQCESLACIDLCLSTVSVCRRTPGSHSHDEHLDSAERHPSCHCEQERPPPAAKAGQILEDSDAFRSAVVLISRGVSIHAHLLILCFKWLF